MPGTKKKAASSGGFVRVGENLYRNESSSRYYALVKKAGKQIKKSLKTKDRKAGGEAVAGIPGHTANGREVFRG